MQEPVLVSHRRMPVAVPHDRPKNPSPSLPRTLVCTSRAGLMTGQQLDKEDPDKASLRLISRCVLPARRSSLLRRWVVP